MNRKILRLAVPNIISNLSVPLLSSVDIFLMGHLDNTRHIDAIAVAGVLFNVIYWSFSFLRMGTTGMVAQAYGKNDHKEIMLLLSQALLVAMAGGAMVLLLQKPIEWLGFWMMAAPTETDELARQYYRIRVWAAPATIGIYALSGWFFGMQNARYPMYITIWVNLVNIGLNMLFVYRFGMASDGVAYATLIAQYAGFVLALFFWLKSYVNFWAHFNRQLLLQVQAFARFFSVNRDIFIRTLCLLFAFSFFTAKSTTAGGHILTANTILLQYVFIMSYAVDGFAYAAESLTGRFKGAKDAVNLRLSVKLSFAWGMGFAALFTLVYLLAGERLIWFFTNNVEVVETAAQYLPWMIFMPLVSAAAFIWDGIFIGTTASRAMRDTMAAALLLVYLPAYYLLFPIWQNHALWLAMTLFMIARALFQQLLAPKYVYQTDVSA